MDKMDKIGQKAQKDKHWTTWSKLDNIDNLNWPKRQNEYKSIEARDDTIIAYQPKHTVPKVHILSKKKHLDEKVTVLILLTLLVTFKSQKLHEFNEVLYGKDEELYGKLKKWVF